MILFCNSLFCFPLVNSFTISRPSWYSFCRSHWWCFNKCWQPVGRRILWGCTNCIICCCKRWRLPEVRSHPLNFKNKKHNRSMWDRKKKINLIKHIQKNNISNSKYGTLQLFLQIFKFTYKMIWNSDVRVSSFHTSEPFSVLVFFFFFCIISKSQSSSFSSIKS